MGSKRSTIAQANCGSSAVTSCYSFGPLSVQTIEERKPFEFANAGSIEPSRTPVPSCMQQVSDSRCSRCPGPATAWQTSSISPSAQTHPQLWRSSSQSSWCRCWAACATAAACRFTTWRKMMPRDSLLQRAAHILSKVKPTST